MEDIEKSSASGSSTPAGKSSENRRGRLISHIRVSETTAAKKTPSHHKVRMSQQDRTLDSMFPILNTSQMPGEGVQSPAPARPPDIQVSKCNLATVLQLRDEIVTGKHEGEFQLLPVCQREAHNILRPQSLQRSCKNTSLSASLTSEDVSH